MKPTVTHQKLAYSAAHDAGNRSMRAAGRTRWTREDYMAAVEEYQRVNPLPPDTNDNKESSARIADAAPELLDALKRLVWQQDNIGHLCKMALHDAIAAIAKAEGDQ